eukprot:156649-Chlamydomonas_euryale.AAC.2
MRQPDRSGQGDAARPTGAPPTLWCHTCIAPAMSAASYSRSSFTRSSASHTSMCAWSRLEKTAAWRLAKSIVCRAWLRRKKSSTAACGRRRVGGRGLWLQWVIGGRRFWIRGCATVGVDEAYEAALDQKTQPAALNSRTRPEDSTSCTQPAALNSRTRPEDSTSCTQPAALNSCTQPAENLHSTAACCVRLGGLDACAPTQRTQPAPPYPPPPPHGVHTWLLFKWYALRACLRRSNASTSSELSPGALTPAPPPPPLPLPVPAPAPPPSTDRCGGEPGSDSAPACMSARRGAPSPEPLLPPPSARDALPGDTWCRRLGKLDISSLRAVR